MVTTPISPAAAEISVSTSLPWRILEYWHLLSLDAPTVAVVWSWAFARAAGVTMPLLNAFLLGLATWLLYVADRLLDGQQTSRATSLRERHYFHAHHQKTLLAVAIPGVFLLAWLGLTHINHTQRMEDLRLSAAAAVYLLCVHLPWRTGRAYRKTSFPKEPAVAIIFATACVIPAWSQQTGAHGWLLICGALFALTCWLNCVAIEAWESSQTSALHGVNRSFGRHLHAASINLASAAAVAALIAAITGKPAFAGLALCVAGSAFLFRTLDRKRAHLTPLQLRAAADAILLTPVALLMMK